jgi:DNA-directed RNA polymerase specialized sigma24 family protein
MEPSRENGSLPRQNSASMRALSDAALVAEMRSGEEAAFREFIVRFDAQLDRSARRLGLAGGDRRVAVAETLDDAALSLIVSGRPTPRSLRTYLVTSLRNRVRNEHRNGARSRVREGRAVQDRNADTPLLCSESSLRASGGPDYEPTEPSPAVTAFAKSLVGDLTADEHQLLGWVSNHVPYREIAAWLDVGYAVVGKRVERLRARLFARADTHLATVGSTDREHLRALLARGAAASPLEPRPAAPPRVAASTIPREGASR